jgi:hypothetical protein
MSEHEKHPHDHEHRHGDAVTVILMHIRMCTIMGWNTRARLNGENTLRARIR